MSAKKPDVWQR